MDVYIHISYIAIVLIQREIICEFENFKLACIAVVQDIGQFVFFEIPALVFLQDEYGIMTKCS